MKDFYVSKSHEDNVAIAGEILQGVIGLNRDQAAVIGLSGELGSGKTTWTKGLVEYLGGESQEVRSPTFILMHDYYVGENIYKFEIVHHLDVYRLKSAKELASLKLDQELKNPHALFVVEWWRQVKSALPQPAAELSFETINDYTRTIQITKP